MRYPHCEVGVSLRRLLPKSIVLYAGDVHVTSCTSDPLAVRPGDVYVALDTGEADGHDLVPVAIERGAAAVIVEQFLPQIRVPMCIVPDTRRAFGRLCQALAGNPSRHLSCIGVTGTDGKSITSRLIGSILREGGRTAEMLDDFSREVDFGSDLVGGSVHSSPDIAAALGEMAACHATHAVLEVSSRALSEHVFAGVRLDAACFTNLTRAHLDRHNSVLSYHQVKRRLLKHLRPGGVSVLNIDDPACANLASFAPGPVITCSLRGPADVTAEILEQNPAEQSFLLSAQSETTVVRTRFIGEHHVQNCLVAAAVGLAAGLDLATIARGIERVDQLPGRLERASGPDFPRVYFDTCSTPTALAAALSTLRSVANGRLWCVSGVPSTSDEDELARFGHVMTCLADAALIVTADDEDTERRRRLNHLIAGLGSAEQAMTCRSRIQAIETAVRMAGNNDVVLIGEDAGPRRTDRQVVRNALSQRARKHPLHLCTFHG